MDYLVLPPEINSARIYSGPGPQPLLEAAEAWESLAQELAESAASNRSVIANLGDSWSGMSFVQMAAAGTQMISWISSTASQVVQSGAAARAAADAYLTARSMSVPPPVIAVNRAQLMTLVATNLLGQNTPAIMANEAQYAEMWAQDVEAMVGYQASSQSAVAALPTFTPASSVANPAAAVSAATPAAPGGILQTLNELFSFMNNSNDVFGPNANFWNGIIGGGLNPATLGPILGQLQLMQKSNDLTEEGNRISEELARDDEKQFGYSGSGAMHPIHNPAESPTFPPPQSRITDRPVIGGGHTAGFLSVPPNWDKATNQVKLASVATPLAGTPGTSGVPMGPPTPIAAVNGPDKKRRDGNEILVRVKFVPDQGI